MLLNNEVLFCVGELVGLFFFFLVFFCSWWRRRNCATGRMTAAEAKAGDEKYDYKVIFSEFKDVFLFPLISGIMFGLGTMAGKKVGEIVFFDKAIAK